MACVHVLAGLFFATWSLPIGIPVNVAGAWYARQGMRYSPPQRMLTPGLDGTNVGGFVGLREREVAGVKVFSSLGSLTASAEHDWLYSLTEMYL